MLWRLEVLEYFKENEVSAVIALAVMLWTVLSAGVGFATKSAGLYAALTLFAVGVGGSFFLVTGKEKYAPLLLCLEGSLAGICYAILFVALAIRRRISARRAQRAEIERRLQYVLPDKENGYLRDRLHTALNGGELGGLSEDAFGLDKGSVDVRLGYARKMLAKIKEAPLSPIERLDVEEMSRLVALYGKRGKWSGSDMKAINEIFSRLLKLSAKYEIAV